MNYEEARQIDPHADRPDAGKWRYTNRNDDRIYPIGYCSPFVPCLDCDGWPQVPGHPVCGTCDGRGQVESEHPCPGHDTREGAERHYYEWEADHLREMTFAPERDVVDGRRKCAVCGAPSLKTLAVEGDMMTDFVLCDEHRHREGWMQAQPFVPGTISIHS